MSRYQEETISLDSAAKSKLIPTSMNFLSAKIRDC